MAFANNIVFACYVGFLIGFPFRTFGFFFFLHFYSSVTIVVAPFDRSLGSNLFELLEKGSVK